VVAAIYELLQFSSWANNGRLATLLQPEKLGESDSKEVAVGTYISVHTVQTQRFTQAFFSTRYQGSSFSINNVGSGFPLSA